MSFSSAGASFVPPFCFFLSLSVWNLSNTSVLKCRSYNMDEVRRVLSSSLQYLNCSVTGRGRGTLHPSTLLLRVPPPTALASASFSSPTFLFPPLHTFSPSLLPDGQGVGCGVKSLDVMYSVASDQRDMRGKRVRTVILNQG